MKEKIIIINNEKCVEVNGDIYCENIEMKSLPESLNKYFDIELILRKSNVNSVHKIGINKITISKNILNFIYNIFKSFKNKNTKYLIIAITPYTFLAYIFLMFRKKNVFLYLRSNGLDEYRLILGKGFTWIYSLMFYLMSKKSKILCVNEIIAPGKNYNLVLPSQIDENWFANVKEPNLKHIKLLYVGRIKIEKGVFSLINLFDQLKLDLPCSLTLVGSGKKIKYFSPNIKLVKPISNGTELKNIYDGHNITILPSFTEGHPQVLLESLARMRPIIIFDEINFVKKKYNGVFISKRDVSNLEKTIMYIVKNYKDIYQEMKKNSLPLKEDFTKEMVRILSG